MTHFHPLPRFAPTTLNAGFARRLPPSSLGGRAAALDPELTFIPSSSDGPVDREADVRTGLLRVRAQRSCDDAEW